jgi:hypothetical protein
MSTDYFPRIFVKDAGSGAIIKDDNAMKVNNHNAVMAGIKNCWKRPVQVM